MKLKPSPMAAGDKVRDKVWTSVAERWLSFAQDNLASPNQTLKLRTNYTDWVNESDYKAAYMFWKASEEMIRVYCLNAGLNMDSSDVAYEIKEAFCNATCFLGLCNMSGMGVTMNKGIALYWFMESIKVPNRKAYNALFQIFMEGLGVQVDYCKAFSYLNICYDLGLSKADDYYNMGVCFLHGLGVEEDEEMAFKHIETAAKMDHLGAIEYMISCCLDGSGISKDVDKAQEYINQYSSLISNG